MDDHRPCSDTICCFIAEMNDMVNDMVAAVDDGDGFIDYDEFVKMIKKYWLKYCQRICKNRPHMKYIMLI